MTQFKTHFYFIWADMSGHLDWRDEARYRAAKSFIEALIAPLPLPAADDPYPVYGIETQEKYSAISDFAKKSGLWLDRD